MYEQLGLPEYNQTKRKVAEIARKIAEGTGREDLLEKNRWGSYRNLMDFAEDYGIRIHRKDAPIDKHDLHAHFGR